MGTAVTTTPSASSAAAARPMSEHKQRFTMFPIQHPKIWRMYKDQLASFWTADEVDFSDDRRQYNEVLNDAEREFVKGVLAFFSATDAIVALNCTSNFCADVPILEAQVAYTYQAMMENIHSEVYSIQIDTIITDDAEKDALFSNLGDMPSVAKKTSWADKWRLNTDAAPFPVRLVAFAIVEGLFFSGAFCAVYWLKQRNLLPGLTKSNEFIARDEGMHTDFACLMYTEYVPEDQKMTEADIREMFREAVDVEKEFINESIKCNMIGMNAQLMATYIEHVADVLLTKLGYDAMYGSHNPFPFMDLIGMLGRSNFFEERPSQYQRAGVHNEDPHLEYDDGF